MNKTDVSYGAWNWTSSGEVRCSKCNSLIGVAFCDEAYTELITDDKFCYNCGLPMLPFANIEKVEIDNDQNTRKYKYEKLDKVIAAYEWCWNEEKHEQDCSGCPYVGAPEGCNKQVDMDTLDLLKEFRELLKFGMKYGHIEFGDSSAEDLDEW